MLKKILTTIFFFLFYHSNLCAQTSIVDSIQEIIDRTEYNQKLKIYDKVVIILINNGQEDNALTIASRALEFAKKNNLQNTNQYFNILENYVCTLTEKKVKLPLALQYAIYGEKKARECNNKHYQIIFLKDISHIYRLQNMYKEAEYNIKEAIQLSEKTENKYLLADCFNAMAHIQYDKKQLKEAIEYSLKALNIFEALKDSTWIMLMTSNLAVYYNEDGNFEQSLQMHRKVLDYYKNSPVDKSVSYYNIALVYQNMKNYKVALKYMDSSYTLVKASEEKALYEHIMYLHDTYYELYLSTKNYEKAIEHRNLYFALKDSLLNENRNKQIAEMNSKYQVEKKEMENKQLKLEKQQQRYIITIIASVGLLLVMVILFVYRAYTTKKQTALMLERKNQVIEIQKKQLEYQNKNITDSIHYASRIQNALLVPDEYLQKYLAGLVKQHFVLYLPKDIVSGDFYWAIQKENYFYLAVCDCTGHGVPGAFMSILNSNLLYESIMEKNILEPGKIFDYIRGRLEETLHGGKDGMDATLVRFNLNNPQDIKYAAAMHQPILIRENEIIKCPFDKIPVGISDIQEMFHTFDLSINDGDSFFMFSDGYADQFGGERDKKLQKSNFHRYLMETNHLNAESQKQELKKRFFDWKNDKDQTDDVCLIGVKF